MTTGNQIYKRHVFLARNLFFFFSAVFPRRCGSLGQWFSSPSHRCPQRENVLKLFFAFILTLFQLLTFCSKKKGWAVRSKAQFCPHERGRVDGTPFLFLWPGPGAPTGGSDLPTCSRLLHPETGVDVMSNFCVSFTLLLPPGLQLFFVVSIYRHDNVIYILKFPFAMLLDLRKKIFSQIQVVNMFLMGFPSIYTLLVMSLDCKLWDTIIMSIFMHFFFSVWSFGCFTIFTYKVIHFYAIKFMSFY